MNIKVSTLKNFQKTSAHIRSTGITPASHCIKFGNGALVKNANSAFISYDCPEATEEVLIDESVLNGLLSNTYSEFINISVQKGKVILSDTVTKIPTGIIPVKEFNDPSVSEGEKKLVSEFFLEALRRSLETCLPYKTPASLYMFVHVGKNMIASGNGFMGIVFPVDEDYTMVLEKSVARIIANNNILSTSESQGHYFFYSDNFTMGFSKQEIGFCEMGKMMQGGDKLTFSVSSSDILSFNSLALSLCKDYSIVTMHKGKLEMIDSRIDSAPVREITSLAPPDPFHYNAENMNQVIDAFGVETLDFYHSSKAYFIKSPDSKATAIIAKISK